ncbi:hypothetical protein BH11GEM2_BH11GEM2_11860 [soil metagenome]
MPLRAHGIALTASCLALVLAACDHGVTTPATTPDFAPDALVLRRKADTIEVGDTLTLSAGYLVGARSVSADAAVRYRSLAPDFLVDSLSGRGVAQDRLPYNPVPVTVVATGHGVADTATVLVLPRILRIGLFNSQVIALQHSIRPLVLVRAHYSIGDQWGSVWAAAGPVTLRSSNSAVVTVDAEGTLTSRATGTTWIVVSQRGHTDSTLVTVTAGYGSALLPGSDSVTVAGVNDGGQVAGYWPARGSVLRGLGISQGGIVEYGDCQPAAINNAGQVACAYGATRYSSGVLEYRQPVGSRATGITEQGTIYGMGIGGTWSPFLWTPQGETTLPGFVSATGKVNSLGHGAATSGSGLYFQGLLTRATGVVGLGGTGRYSAALGLNDADDVVGSSESMGSGYTLGILWRAANGWITQSLGVRTRRAVGISETGLVVGEGADGPFLWRGDRYALLSDVVAESGWIFTGTPAISRNGTIATYGIHASSGRRGVLLIPPGGLP